MSICRLDWTAIGTVASALATASAAILLWWQIRSANHIAGVNLVFQMEVRFWSPEMRAQRADAVRVIGTKFVETTEWPSIDDVLDFFDTVGFLARKGDIDTVMAWHTFYEWIHGYRLSMAPYIECFQRDDKTLWEDFLWLDDRVCEIQIKRAGAKTLPWTDAEILDFRNLEAIQEGPRKASG